MTKLLEEAFAKAWELSEEDEDYVAAMVLGFCRPGKLTTAIS
jgi:hypothetical protein